MEPSRSKNFFTIKFYFEINESFSRNTGTCIFCLISKEETISLKGLSVLKVSKQTKVIQVR